MSIIKKYSYACAACLTKSLNDDHKKRAVYYFSFQVIIGMIVKLVLLIIIGLVLGILPVLFALAAAFGSLRMVAGGYHMDTFGKCFASSAILFTASASIAKYTYMYWNYSILIAFIISTLILGVFCAVKYVPRDTPTKRIASQKDIIKFKKLSLLYFAVWTPAVGWLLFNGHYAYVLALCFGASLELTTVTPWGSMFFDKISAWFDKYLK